MREENIAILRKSKLIKSIYLMILMCLVVVVFFVLGKFYLEAQIQIPSLQHNLSDHICAASRFWCVLASCRKRRKGFSLHHCAVSLFRHPARNS